MKLLTPVGGKSLKDIEIAQQESRLVEIDKVIRDKRKEISQLDSDLANSLAETNKEAVEKKQALDDHIKTLTREVEALESRHKAALVPLVEREKAADTRESALSKREELVVIKESENESERHLLENRLDEVSEREEAANTYFKQLNSREFAIGLQEKQIEQRQEALVAILLESFADIHKAQEDSARYKATLKGRDVSITERESYVESQLASFSNREKKILDQYRTLQRAITETNLKK